MIYPAPLAALALGMLVTGCGGGGGGGAPAGGGEFPTEERSFEFTVPVPNATAPVQNPTFFVDSGLSTQGVELRSTQGTFGTTGASFLSQSNPVQPVEEPFQLVIHFDASGSMDDNGRDPAVNGQEPRRFPAARGLVAGVGGANPTRVYTFRSGYPNFIRLWSPSDFPASDSAAANSAIDAAKAEVPDTNSPALSATANIIDQISAPRTAMLLLTDGENNSEDQNIVPGCTGGEGSNPDACFNIGNVVSKAQSRNVRIFVAGLGNEDRALSKFRDLAEETGAAYVKATRAGALEAQFRDIGALIKSGGVVVSGVTDEFEIRRQANPIIAGYLRFDRPASGACPAGDPVTVGGTNYCRLAFGQP